MKLDKILLGMGVEVSWVDTTSISQVKGALNNNTKMVLIETPTNPMMKLTALIIWLRFQAIRDLVHLIYHIVQ